MPYLTGLYAELIDLGPDDGRVVALTPADIAGGYLELPRHRPPPGDQTGVTRWAWDGTTNGAGHYRFRRTVPSDRAAAHCPRQNDGG
ncbi:MAG: hypothetical protein JOY78_18740 [Pseudonocardia sp.]|nr:hypothetical protein [Pseudonocardia sp.]